MADYTELCSFLRNDARQMEEHAVTFDRVSVIKDCRESADVIEGLQAEKNKWVERHKEAAVNWQEAARCVANLEAENSTLRNDLCQKCGRYRDAHNGACDGCRWRVGNG